MPARVFFIELSYGFTFLLFSFEMLFTHRSPKSTGWAYSSLKALRNDSGILGT